MNFLNKQIHFTSSFYRSLLIGLGIGLFLSFILLFIEPFDTNEFESSNRFILLLGFGMLLSSVYIVYSLFENALYIKLDRIWMVKHEVGSVLLYFVFAGSVIYFYNHFIVNEDHNYSLESHWWYYKNVVSVMIPLIAPLLVYGRQKLGEKTILLPQGSFIVTGENKNELLQLDRSQVLYVQAMENYVEIYYFGTENTLLSKTFRKTLSKVHQQIPFLSKCHRSFLVNMDLVDEIEGNSQSAKLSFRHIDNKVPVSKTLYKNIKDIYSSKKVAVHHK